MNNPNGKKFQKLPQNGSIFTERVRLWDRQRAAFIQELTAKTPATPPVLHKPSQS